MPARSRRGAAGSRAPATTSTSRSADAPHLAIGRGNQQLSPAVLRRIGIGNIEVVAGMHKLLSLDPPWLRVDTGYPALDSELAGYRRIQIAPNRTLVYKVAV